MLKYLLLNKIFNKTKNYFSVLIFKPKNFLKISFNINPIFTLRHYLSTSVSLLTNVQKTFKVLYN